jgi:hypothetical protein
MSGAEGVEILCLTCLTAIHYNVHSPAVICNCPAGDHTAVAVSRAGFHSESKARFVTFEE